MPSRERYWLAKRSRSRCRSAFASGIEILKYLYSIALLAFSVIIVMAANFSDQTVATGENNVHPALAFFIFWFLIFFLAMLEGGQGCLVGLQPVDKALYAETHPVALMSTTLAHRGGNMERFIVGRQFLVVFVVFALNMTGGAISGASVLGLNSILTDIFLASGVAVILITVVLGQIVAQINAANCMLDFINNYFTLFTTYVSLAIEASGIMHAVYLVQIFFKVTGRVPEAKEPPRGIIASVIYWARVFISLGLLGFSFAVTLSALFQGKSKVWDGVPAAVSVVVFFVLMAFIGLMEGMQIALFAVVNMPQEVLALHPIAAKNCQLTFRGQNLQAFLIGRQICVTCCTFIVARIASVNVDTATADSENIFGVSDGIQKLFNTGLLGAVITTIVGSLAWRIIATSFPVAFLSHHLIYLIIRLCLLLEKSGVCSAAWLLAFVHKSIVNYKLDEVYIGTPDERVAAESTDELKLVEEALDAQLEPSKTESSHQ